MSHLLVHVVLLIWMIKATRGESGIFARVRILRAGLLKQPAPPRYVVPDCGLSIRTRRPPIQLKNSLQCDSHKVTIMQAAT